MYKETLNLEENVNKSREILTPYKIAIALLVKAYCSTNSREKSIQERRDFCIVMLKLIQTPDVDFSMLLSMLYSKNHTLKRFASELEAECVVICKTGIEGLMDLFDVLTRLMKPPLDTSVGPHLLCRNSVLGLYIRRINMLFEQLSFSEGAQLYDSFVKDFEQSIIRFTKFQNSQFKDNVIKKINNMNVWDDRRAELLVAQQAEILQINEQKALPPAELQALIYELLNFNPQYAEAHYLSYLNCLRVNEYCGALDSLHHCFDQFLPNSSRITSDDKSRTFRYAALNLAALHAQFDQKKVAQSALREAIMMAQEAGDNVCLQLTHAWIHYLSNQTKPYLIERSIGKACTLGITHTMSLGLIASAHYSALESTKPTTVFETLMKSDVLNCQHSMLDLMSMAYAEKSALWAYYGKVQMSIICSQILLLYNSGSRKQTLFNGGSTCQAVMNVANVLADMGEYKLVNVILNHAKERFPTEPSNKIWMLSEQLIEFTKFMRNQKLNDAETIAMQISSLDNLESKFRLAEVSLAKKDYSSGLNYLNNLKRISKPLTAQDQIRLIILTSQLIDSAVMGANGLASIKSLILLNHALEIASNNHLSYWGSIIKVHLAKVQLMMGMPKQALCLVDEAIINILTHGSLYDQGEALTLHAECLVAASFLTAKQRTTAIQGAVKSLLRANECFSKIEAFNKMKTTMYTLAVMYNELDMKAERNQCAFEFKKLNEQ
ncbi:anaphase-promoting complex subunit 5 [Chelonus insularis]|uniref:anaphase-promoting complex subunit 5 n=1 Tax=Chelonus insularis TaxID=460826 RepID=UPI00158E3A64|nr:anaphase-promoting complex subunit 5 [Chelonus insularis]